MTSPERESGVKYRLRFTVANERIDQLLADCSDEQTRQTLRDYLFVYSESAYDHLVTDEDYDGFSPTQHRLDQARRQLNDYDRDTFSMTSRLDVKGHFLRLGVSLGQLAASKILIPPFTFTPEEIETHSMNVYYPVQSHRPIDPGVYRELGQAAAAHTRNVFQELTVVDMHRPFEHRTVRPPKPRLIPAPDDILQL